jgi:hypothetical protein
MFRNLLLSLALAGATAVITAVGLGTAPTVNAASVPDIKSCPHSVHANINGKMAHQTGPQPISQQAGSVKPSDIGTRLNSGCQPLAAPLPQNFNH